MKILTISKTALFSKAAQHAANATGLPLEQLVRMVRAEYDAQRVETAFGSLHFIVVDSLPKNTAILLTD